MGVAASRRPEELNKLIKLQLAIFVLVMLSDQSLDFAVFQTEAVQGRSHLGQGDRATLVSVQLIEHLTYAVDPARHECKSDHK